MKVLIDLVAANPVFPLFIIIAVLFLVKNEDWLTQTKKNNQNPMMIKWLMVVAVLLIGIGTMVIGGISLRVEQNKHRYELSVKNTEIRLLNKKIEYLTSN